MELEGTSIIGNGRGRRDAGATFCASNRVSGGELSPEYMTASEGEIAEAVRLARQAAPELARLPGEGRGALLRAIADVMEKNKAALVERTPMETGYPEMRIHIEFARTVGQLRLFAEVVEEGSWVQARIDHGDPQRKPLPKPDVRSMLRPLGPVAVFGASNFPLAISAVGNDTVAALAAGNPVVVKAHPAHPGTGEIIGLCVAEAIRSCDLPEGAFSLLFDGGHEVGRALVLHPEIRAVGFTGSLRGGRALMDLAAMRSEPISVFAEMGSVNPVFLLPGALRERGKELAQALHGSLTAGAGQMCTNPGIVVAGEDPALGDFRDAVAELVRGTPAGVMLTEGIRASYERGTGRLREWEGVWEVASGGEGGAFLFETGADRFVEDSVLHEEVFGPSTLLVRCGPQEELVRVAESMEGQLTASVHGTEEDLMENRRLLETLERRVGRLIINGFPTGVEVCHAMVHGGPYPATSDGRSTSIGTLSIERFVRPVAFQDMPDALLPGELKEANPLGIVRLVDGKWGVRDR